MGLHYVRWTDEGGLEVVATAAEADTLAYMTQDGIVFLPRDGQAIPEWPPRPEDGWYELSSGRSAIVGLDDEHPLTIIP